MYYIIRSTYRLFIVLRMKVLRTRLSTKDRHFSSFVILFDEENAALSTADEYCTHFQHVEIILMLPGTT